MVFKSWQVWLVGEVVASNHHDYVGIYGSKAAEDCSVFQCQSFKWSPWRHIYFDFFLLVICMFSNFDLPRQADSMLTSLPEVKKIKFLTMSVSTEIYSCILTLMTYGQTFRCGPTANRQLMLFQFIYSYKFIYLCLFICLFWMHHFIKWCLPLACKIPNAIG